MKHRSAMIHALWIVAFFAVPAWATIIVTPTDGQLVDQSPLVVVADVQSSVPVARAGAIWTETTLQVVRILKGSVPGPTIIVREMGGELGDRRTVVFGSPSYSAGERVLVFLWPRPRDAYQTRNLFLGKFVESEVNGRRIWQREGDPEGTVLLDQSLRRIDLSREAFDADSFESFIRSRAAGRATPAPIAVDSSPSRVATPKFTLMDEPAIYRWFAFDDGQAVDWWSVGSQDGYADGGTSEIERAVSAWSGYASAKIDYRYAGPSDHSAGSLGKPDGINEIMFEDPLDEIDGHWSGAGVLGRAGFNEVRGPRTWSSEFRADAEHPKATFSNTWEIVEADVVIQDGVSPSTGIDSNELAELIAHELGHTLGLGHSTDSTALMSASLTGRGATLSEDDEDAARWLYPTGPYPDAPSAPTDLRVVSAVNQSVTLQWVDQANNEAAQVVYMARETGDFQLVARVASNVETATVSRLQGGTTYEFYVAARNDGGESSPSNIVSVKTPVTAIAADFEIEPPTGIAGLTRFVFVDRSAGPVTSWAWTFGDGWSSASSTPIHRYTMAGRYRVALRVESATGQQSTIAHDLIVDAATASVVARFDSATEIHSGTATTFVDRSTGSPSWWSWQFGDGSTSSEQSPSHQYAAPGRYVVTLVAGNDAGSSTATKEVEVAPPSFSAVLPVTGRLVGANQAMWTTSLGLMNDGSQPVDVTLTFLPSDDGPGIVRDIVIGSGVTRYWNDVLAELFGLAQGAGAIAIRGDSAGVETPRIVTAERIHTRVQSGTFGQYVPAVPPSAERVRYLTGLRSDQESRTNVGLVNPTSESAVAHLELRDASGALVGSADLPVPAGRFRQTGLREIFPPSATNEGGPYSLDVDADPALICYASIVDNKTQDPMLVVAKPMTPGRRLVPVAARTAGVNGTYWQSTLVLFNPLGANLDVTIGLLDGSDQRSVLLPPHQSVAIDDALGWIGSTLPSGALSIETDRDGVIVASRVYTSTTGGGTFGESVRPWAASTVGDRFTIAGLFDDEDFRTNVGVVNDGANPVDISVTLLNERGDAIGTTSFRMKARAFFQEALHVLFADAESASGPLSVRIASSKPTVMTWASVVDNHSGDPTLIPGQ